MEHASRHRAPGRSPWPDRKPGRGRRLALAGVGVAVSGALVAAALAAAGSPEARSADKCPAGAGPLEVLVAPEIEPAVSAVVEVLSTDGDEAPAVLCGGAVVRAEDPAETVAAMAADLADRPDVWVPDSSAWTAPALSRGAGLPAGGPSVATSPFVLAVPAGVSADRPLRAERLLGSEPAVRWALPDPARSPSAAAAVLALRTALAQTPGGAGQVAQLVRAGAGRPPALAALAGSPVPTALPVTEQQVLAATEAGSARRVVPAYLPTLHAADYPFLVLATDRDARVQATALLEALRGDLGRRLLAADGFRDRQGVLGAVASKRSGVHPAARPPRVPTAAEIGTAVRTVAVIRRPSRVLAVVDVSGSMGQVVDAAGGTRLSLALGGLLTGLAAYPDDTVTGLWTFSTRLTGTTDHEELVPLVRLGVGPDGTVGRSRLAQALTQVRVRATGGTGLYDTTWAAVRAVRRGWDPHRANAVVLVTDGANSDDHGLSLPGLLRRLREVSRDDRPVPVYGVAIGPDADLRSLRAVARVTGGQAYTVLDPRQVVPAIQDAVGRRG